MTSESPPARGHRWGAIVVGCVLVAVLGLGLGHLLLLFWDFGNLFAPIELTEKRLDSYRKRFERNRDALTDLKTMVLKEDRIRTVGPLLIEGVTPDARTVAYRRIGTKWGKAKWSNDRTLQDVLDEIGMPRARYDAYAEGLTRIKGHWVTRITSRTAVVNLISSGIVTNAVTVDYLWAPDGQLSPRTPAWGEGDEVEFMPLSDGWFLRIQRD